MFPCPCILGAWIGASLSPFYYPHFSHPSRGPPIWCTCTTFSVSRCSPVKHHIQTALQFLLVWPFWPVWHTGIICKFEHPIMPWAGESTALSQFFSWGITVPGKSCKCLGALHHHFQRRCPMPAHAGCLCHCSISSTCEEALWLCSIHL